MHKTLTSFLFFCSLSLQCRGEIVLNFPSTVPQAEQQKIEDAIHQAALKFTEKKYADRGAYNFVTTSTRFVVRFVNLRGLGGTYSAACENYENKNLVTLDAKLLRNLPALKIFALHEFSHAYDDMFPKISRCGRNCDTEYNAQKKEEWFFQEMKDPLPSHLYQLYIQRHTKQNDAEIRRKVLLELIGE